jgi:hypothetical protein
MWCGCGVVWVVVQTFNLTLPANQYGGRLFTLLFVTVITLAHLQFSRPTLGLLL